MCGFIALKEIEPAIPIIIEPNASLGRVSGQQAGSLGNVGKSAVAIIPQEGTRNPSWFVEPRPALDPNIQQAVIVVICLLHVESAGQALEPRLGSAFGKMAVAIVVEIVNLGAQVPGRKDHINESVIIEIIQDTTAGKSFEIQT